MLELEKSKKDMALLLEVLFGLFFVLGVGWIYAGNKIRGGALLAGTLFLSAPSMFSIIFATGGFGFFCCALPTYLFLIIDVFALRKWLENPVYETFGVLFKKGCVLYLVGIIVIILSVIFLWGRLPLITSFLQHGFSR